MLHSIALEVVGLVVSWFLDPTVLVFGGRLLAFFWMAALTTAEGFGVLKWASWLKACGGALLPRPHRVKTAMPGNWRTRGRSLADAPRRFRQIVLSARKARVCDGSSSSAFGGWSPLSSLGLMRQRSPVGNNIIARRNGI